MGAAGGGLGAGGDAEKRDGENAAGVVHVSARDVHHATTPRRAIDPLPVAGAKGSYFWTADGRRFLDFNSQLMCVNIGHGDERVQHANGAGQVQPRVEHERQREPRGAERGRDAHRALLQAEGDDVGEG